MVYQDKRKLRWLWNLLGRQLWCQLWQRQVLWTLLQRFWGKPAEVVMRKLPTTPISTPTSEMSTSKIPHALVRSASPAKWTPLKEMMLVSATLQSAPRSNSKIPHPIAKEDQPVSSKTPLFSAMSHFFWKLLCPCRLMKKNKTRKPWTPVVPRVRCNRWWELYCEKKTTTCSPKERLY